MRAKLISHSEEWLVGDYEAPPALANKNFLTVWCVHRDFRTNLTAMKITGGAGVWDESGNLLFYLRQACDLVWAKNSADLYSLESRFGPCRRAKGVRHALRRLVSGTFHALGEMELCVPTGGVERLVVNRKGDMSLATWLDQSQWGYVLIDLRTMAQLPGGLYHPTASLAPPDFSPDDTLVVSCSRFKSGWWTDIIDDYWDSPSQGGFRKVGTISVHNLASNALSQHEVIVELPKGWIPDRPSDPQWSMIWGPEFVSARSFKFWLPDESSETLSLPLPARIEITRPLGTKRRLLE